jgi:hypothetical protein
MIFDLVMYMKADGVTIVAYNHYTTFIKALLSPLPSLTFMTCTIMQSKHRVNYTKFTWEIILNLTVCQVTKS